MKIGSYLRHQGLSCFSPNMDVLRDPRWGRNEGTWGEDPYLAGVYARWFVRGIQGDESARYLILSASCKHYAASGGPDSYPLNRMSFDAKVSLRDLRTTFLPGFRECVRGGSYSVLCSYNRINGIPGCANNFTLQQILRKEWGFNGYVISDVGAMEGMITGHHYYKDFVEVAAAGLSSGCNINAAQTDNRSQNAYYSALQAIEEGKLSASVMRELSRPLWYTRLRLGEFDPPSMVPYRRLDLSIIQSPEHRALSVEAAMKTFVLLKNLNQSLPLKNTKYNNIAIVGPMTNNPEAQTGNYSPDIMLDYTTTPLDGLSQLGDDVKSTPGCLGDNNCTQYDPIAVKAVVTDVDIVFVCLGLGNDVEMEDRDRQNISLPGHQLDILKDVVANSPSNATIILILFNAGAVDIRYAVNEQRVSAILEVFYPSQATGTALRKVLTMDGPNSVPAGRLPFTWPATDDQV
ncbi:uncharacterized protein LOC126810509 [Patella vulgata]|uniref:uncharacterized protein LOC126810509 n=1 Tax=Patella vulgata TaxID=6465 RepID=UPI0024A83452|nr:uncharacterized protein LOC126810509 [Patella vulgata]